MVLDFTNVHCISKTTMIFLDLRIIGNGNKITNLMELKLYITKKWMWKQYYNEILDNTTLECIGNSILFDHKDSMVSMTQG